MPRLDPKLLPLLLVPLLIVTARPLAALDEHLTRVGPIEVEHAWTRATTGPDAAVFMTIGNRGDAPDRLLGASTAAAASVAIHGATMVDGEPGSLELGPIDLPAGGRMELEPQAAFLLLRGLRQPLVEGGELELEIRFEQAGSGTVHVEVGATDAVAHSHAGHAH